MWLNFVELFYLSSTSNYTFFHFICSPNILLSVHLGRPRSEYGTRAQPTLPLAFSGERPARMGLGGPRITQESAPRVRTLLHPH